VSDEQIKEWLMEGMEGEAYAYGYRKLTVFLRRTYGLCINKKKSVPIMQGDGYSTATAPKTGFVSKKAGTKPHHYRLESTV